MPNILCIRLNRNKKNYYKNMLDRSESINTSLNNRLISTKIPLINSIQVNIAILLVGSIILVFR